MSQTAKNLLRYYRMSLADGERMDIPSRTVVEKGRQLTSLDAISPKDLAFFFASLPETQDVLDVLLCPVRLIKGAIDGRRANSTIIYPVWVPAVLKKNGELMPPESELILPWMVRGVLAPNDHLPTEYPCITSVDKIDEFQGTTSLPREDGWRAYWDSALTMFEHQAGTSIFNMVFEGWITETSVVAMLPAELQGAADKVIALYDHLLSASELALPPTLRMMLTGGGIARTTVVDPDLECLSARHLGQMGSKFPLSLSQRVSLSLFDKTTVGKVLAVNGPPGTGKTTLIQSIVADMVVKTFLEKERPPVIIGSSANNKAITNILDSFTSVVPPPEARTGLNERWLPEIEAIGHYLSAFQQTRLEAAKNAGYWVSTQGKEGIDAYQIYCDGHRKVDCESYFLSKYRGYFGETAPSDLPSALELLKKKAQECVVLIEGKVDDIRSIIKTIEYFGIQREALDSLAAQALEKLEQWRRKRDFLDGLIQQEGLRSRKPNFLAGLFDALRYGSREARCARIHAKLSDMHDMGLSVMAGSLYEIAPVIWSMRNESSHKYIEGSSLWKGSAQSVSKVCALLEAAPSATTETTWVERLQGQLDVNERHQAFWLAIHGLELAWLINRNDETYKKLNTGENDSSLRWNQRSYLTPVFVSTFHSLPGFFSYNKKNPQSEKWIMPPLTGLVDLLVIDEAGQVAPELGVAAFGLAERALVVGDVRQLEPIWNIPSESIDCANAMRSGVISDRDGYDTFLHSQRSCLNSSLMMLAQLASEFQYPADWQEPGSLLVEHRRCVPDIIEYCNRFVYSSLLKVKTKPVEAYWPAMGYCHVPGESKKTAGSQANVLEAQAIALWISQNITEIVNTSGKTLAESLAIITPFRAQRDAILAALADKGVPTKGLVVGTVHALQGAERPMVIFSPVYGRNHRGGSLFFNQSYNMLNVAVSRAKQHFLVFGTMSHFKTMGSRSPSSDLGILLFQHESNALPEGFLYEDEQLPILGSGPVHRISKLIIHRESLKKAFSTAQKRLVIVSPFISSVALNADNIPDLVRSATGRGVDVIVFTDARLDSNNGLLRQSAKEGREQLIAAGAELRVKDGIHNKTLIIDRSVIIEGSFNWFSAIRDEQRSFCRLDASLVVKDAAADPY